MIFSIHAQWFSIHHSLYSLQLAMTLSCRPNTASEGHAYMYPFGIAMGIHLRSSTQWFHISIMIVTDLEN